MKFDFIIFIILLGLKYVKNLTCLIINFLPETKCVYSLVRCDNSRLQVDFSFMFDYLKKNNLNHSGDVITRAVINTHQNWEFNRYLQVWMPVE